jgi:hypothetical protein
MTYKQAQKEARQHGMTIRKTSAGDYRVAFKGADEIQAVYEASLEDALDTAQAMYNREQEWTLGKRSYY